MADSSGDYPRTPRLGIMIEGQEGLTWERWRRLCADVERLGFAALRRSDHLFSVMGVSDRDCIDCWTSLALAAEWTSKIQIGPMVTPMTFKHAAVLAREAASVDALSGGRLILGVGAGWYQAEHDAFGLRLPESMRERFDNLEAGIDRIKQTWAMNNPKPVRGEVPLLLGGKGLKRTVPLAARVAAEWNMNGGDPETYREASTTLDREARAAGREAGDIKRSLMAIACVGRTHDEAIERAQRLRQVIPRLKELAPEQVLNAIPFGGSAEEVAEKMRPWAAAGVQLFMLQHFLLDDPGHLEALAEDLAPRIA